MACSSSNDTNNNTTSTDNQIANFIRTNYMGANIIIITVNGATLTGEVVDGSGNIIGLRTGAGVITFVNAAFIVSWS